MNHDNPKPLSRAGQARKDAMLPLLQDAMRDAVRQRRQRQSVAGFVLIGACVLLGWGLLDFSAQTKPTPTMVADDSNSVESVSTPSLDWQAFDPVANYDTMSTDAIIITSSTSVSELPVEWRIDHTLVHDLPTISGSDLLQLCAANGITAAIVCNPVRCEFRRLSSSETNEEPMG